MNAKVSSLAFVMYPVTDMARARAFYEETLGLVQDGIASDGWVEYGLGDTTFGIGNFEQVGVAGQAMSLALEVDDMNAYRAQLTQRGVSSAEPYETPICFISSCSDPDGNRVYLHQRKS